MIKIGVLGGLGKMGRLIIQEVLAHPQLELMSIGLHHNKNIPIELSSLPFTSSLDEIYQKSDLIIDFTEEESFKTHVRKGLEYKKPMVIGTTGLTEDDFSYLQEVKNKIPFFYSANMNIGVFFLTEIVEYLAKNLDEKYDVEIFEAHHRYKKDAPSGTALSLGEAVARGRKKSSAPLFCFDRSQLSHPRANGEIGFASVRAGHIIGDHQVIFANEDEMISLSHRALNRENFAKGAIRATLWLYHQQPGLYSMKNLFNDFLSKNS